jgi:hypothetical protein
MLVVEEKVNEFIGSMKDYQLTTVDVFNGEGTE